MLSSNKCLRNALQSRKCHKYYQFLIKKASPNVEVFSALWKNGFKYFGSSTQPISVKICTFLNKCASKHRVKFWNIWNIFYQKIQEKLSRNTKNYNKNLKRKCHVSAVAKFEWRKNFWARHKYVYARYVKMTQAT